MLQAYKKFVAMKADLMDERDRMGRQIAQMQKDVQAKNEELAASGYAPDSKEYVQIRKELLRMSIEGETFVKLSENELRLNDKRIKDTCLRDILDAVRKVSERKGLAMVFQQVLYAGYQSAGIGSKVDLPFRPEGVKLPINLWLNAKK